MAVALEGQSLLIERPTETGFGVFETTFALQTMVIRPTEYHHPQIFSLLFCGHRPLFVCMFAATALCMCSASEKWGNICRFDLLSTKNLISEENYLLHKILIIIVEQVVPAQQLSTLYHSLLPHIHKAPFCNDGGQQTPGHTRLICWAFPLVSPPSSIPFSIFIRPFCLILSTTATCLGSVWG